MASKRPFSAIGSDEDGREETSKRSRSSQPTEESKKRKFSSTKENTRPFKRSRPSTPPPLTHSNKRPFSQIGDDDEEPVNSAPMKRLRLRNPPTPTLLPYDELETRFAVEQFYAKINPTLRSLHHERLQRLEETADDNDVDMKMDVH